MNDLTFACCCDNYVLVICNLCKCFVCPYLVTFCTVPVFNISFIVTSWCYCFHMYNIAFACCWNDYIFVICKLCKCFVCPYFVTFFTIPVFDISIKVTTWFYFFNMYYIITKCWDNYIFMICELCKCFICPYYFTFCTIPMFDISVIVAASFYCFHMYNIAFTCCRNDYALMVRNLCTSFICPYCITFCTVPMFYITIKVASWCYCCYIYYFSTT